MGIAPGGWVTRSPTGRWDVLSRPGQSRQCRCPKRWNGTARRMPLDRARRIEPRHSLARFGSVARKRFKRLRLELSRKFLRARSAHPVPESAKRRSLEFFASFANLTKGSEISQERSRPLTECAGHCDDDGRVNVWSDVPSESSAFGGFQCNKDHHDEVVKYLDGAESSETALLLSDLPTADDRLPTRRSCSSRTADVPCFPR